MLEQGSKVGIVCCSNGRKQTSRNEQQQLEQALLSMGLQPVWSRCVYQTEQGESATEAERARELMDFYRNDAIRAVFDISGGDLANGILPYLDYAVIARSSKMFWGYSDLTTVLNAVYAKTGKTSVLYQVRNLIYDHQEEQKVSFFSTVRKGEAALFQLRCRMVQKTGMQGVVIGGNIRCFLKLAGTEYMPDLENRILLLESYGGSAAAVESYLCQLQQLGAFEKAAGILLGTFTQLEAEQGESAAERLVKKAAGPAIPIAVTRQIGHGTDAKGIRIGQSIQIR